MSTISKTPPSSASPVLQVGLSTQAKPDKTGSTGKKGEVKQISSSGALARPLRSMEKGVRKKVKRIKRAVALRKTGGKVSSRKLNVSTEDLRAAAPRKRAAKAFKAVRNTVADAFRTAPRPAAAASSRKRKSSSKKAHPFQPYPKGFAARFLNSDRIKPQIAEYEAMDATALKAIAENLATTASSAAKTAGNPACVRPQDYQGLKQACDYLAQLDSASGRIKELAAQLDEGTISESGKQELADTIRLHSENVALAQTHLANMLDEHTAQASQTKRFIDVSVFVLAGSITRKLATHHMALADAQATCGGHLPAARNPAGKLEENALAASAFVASLRLIADAGAGASLDGTIAIAEAHSQALNAERAAHASAASSLRSLSAAPPQAGEAAGEATSVGQLRDFWDTKTNNGDPPDASWLPPAQPPLTQEIVLNEFLRYQAERHNISLPAGETRAFLFAEGLNRAKNAQNWQPVERMVSAYSKDGTAGNYSSRMIPAGHQLAARLPAKYQGGINEGDYVQHQHVRNLAVSEMTNAEGKTIARSLRHAALDPKGITPAALRTMPAAQLVRLLEDTYWQPNMATTDMPNVAAFAYHCTQNASTGELEKICGQMRENAARGMARELASAILVSDEDKYARVMKGELVDLPVNEISLLTPDMLRQKGDSERAMLKRQSAALKSLAAEQQPMTLEIRTPEGGLRKVKVNLRLRQFNFGVDEAAHRQSKIPFAAPLMRKLTGWGYSAELNDPALASLVGKANDNTLGGAAGERAQALSREIIQLRRDLDEVKRIAADTSTPPAGTAAHIADLEKKIADRDREFAGVMGCVVQVKALWRRGAFRASGPQAYELAARIAVMLNLLGETPAISDANGLDRTNPLDVEIKYLAAQAEADEGAVPRFDEPAEKGAPLRARIMLNNGGTELRNYNSGRANT